MRGFFANVELALIAIPVRPTQAVRRDEQETRWEIMSKK
jgi:hypothetical protein